MLEAINLSVKAIVFGGHLQWPSIWEYCVSLKQALAVIPFLRGIKSIHSSSCSNPFDEWQNKREIETTHSFRFTVFYRAEIVAQRYHTYLLWYLLGFRNVYIERSLLYDSISCSHPFALWWCRYLTGALETMSRTLVV